MDRYPSGRPNSRPPPKSPDRGSTLGEGGDSKKSDTARRTRVYIPKRRYSWTDRSLDVNNLEIRRWRPSITKQINRTAFQHGTTDKIQNKYVTTTDRPTDSRLDATQKSKRIRTDDRTDTYSTTAGPISISTRRKQQRPGGKSTVSRQKIDSSTSENTKEDGSSAKGERIPDEVVSRILLDRSFFHETNHRFRPRIVENPQILEGIKPPPVHVQRDGIRGQVRPRESNLRTPVKNLFDSLSGDDNILNKNSLRSTDDSSTDYYADEESTNVYLEVNPQLILNKDSFNKTVVRSFRNFKRDRSKSGSQSDFKNENLYKKISEEERDDDSVKVYEVGGGANWKVNSAIGDRPEKLKSRNYRRHFDKARPTQVPQVTTTTPQMKTDFTTSDDSKTDFNPTSALPNLSSITEKIQDNKYNYRRRFQADSNNIGRRENVKENHEENEYNISSDRLDDRGHNDTDFKENDRIGHEGGNVNIRHSDSEDQMINNDDENIRHKYGGESNYKNDVLNISEENSIKNMPSRFRKTGSVSNKPIAVNNSLRIDTDDGRSRFVISNEINSRESKEYVHWRPFIKSNVNGNPAYRSATVDYDTLKIDVETTAAPTEATTVSQMNTTTIAVKKDEKAAKSSRADRKKRKKNSRRNKSSKKDDRSNETIELTDQELALWMEHRANDKLYEIFRYCSTF